MSIAAKIEQNIGSDFVLYGVCIMFKLGIIVQSLNFCSPVLAGNGHSLYNTHYH